MRRIRRLRSTAWAALAVLAGAACGGTVGGGSAGDVGATGDGGAAGDAGALSVASPIAGVRGADWSTAGVVGGIPPRTTVCATLHPGADGPAISAAIAACPSGQTVMLGAGTYMLSTGIDFNAKGGVTLRGAGADATLLVFGASAAINCRGQLADVCVDSSDTNWGGGPSNLAN
jgi:pectin methylesterase-like acyl-CoA thioesterase